MSADDASERTISIRQLKALYKGYPLRIDEQVAVGGVVVGTDRYGELHNQLVVQDHTGGVVFSIDNSRLYETYSVGDSLHINCCGLTLGAYGHSVRVGDAPQGDGYQTSPIDWTLWQDIATHCGCGREPKSLRLAAIGELAPHHISTLVRLDRVRFVEAGEPLAVKGESQNRHLVSAESPNPTDTLEVRASGYSDFYDLVLPAGSCSVVGIAGYFHNGYQLVITSPDNIVKQ